MDLSKIEPEHWLEKFNVEISKNNHWVAFNAAVHQMESNDVFFFADRLRHWILHRRT